MNMLVCVAHCCGPTHPTAPLVEIRDNLAARIAQAEREGWLGEVEGLQVSLAAAEDKLAKSTNDRERPLSHSATPHFPPIPDPPKRINKQPRLVQRMRHSR